MSEPEYVEWDHIATPFVLKNRDFVFDAKLDFKPAQNPAHRGARGTFV